MKEERYRFLELMGNVEDDMIYQSSQPWHNIENKKTTAIYPGKIAVCFVLVIALCIGGIFHQQVEAAIRNFTTKIAEILGVSGDLTPYTEIIGVSQTKEGVTLTLEEVILAENQLYAVFHMEYEKGMNLGKDIRYLGVDLADPKIDGMEIVPVSSGVWMPDYDEESKTLQNILVSYVYDDDSLPYEINEIELEARVFSETDLEDEEIPFTFHFSASREELREDTHSMMVDYEIKADNGAAITLHKIQLNKVFSRISASPNEIFLQEMMEKGYVLMGTDSQGNSLKYEMSGGSEDNLIFESAGMPPSEDSEWMEIQLYDMNDQDYVPAGEKVRIEYKN